MCRAGRNSVRHCGTVGSPGADAPGGVGVSRVRQRRAVEVVQDGGFWRARLDTPYGAALEFPGCVSAGLGPIHRARVEDPKEPTDCLVSVVFVTAIAESHLTAPDFFRLFAAISGLMTKQGN